MAIAMGVIAILAALMIPLLSQLTAGSRALKANDEAARVYMAIVGNPAVGSYGYLGDVGRYPSSIMDLVRNPGLEGWNGPYLSGISIVGTVVVDPFGSAFEYYNAVDPGSVSDVLAIISKGPDQSSTNTSLTPNVASTYAGAPLPSSGTYSTTAPNPDNIEYPRFTNNADALYYNNVGTLNLTIVNFDNNPAVSALVPACPNMFEIKVTSSPRSTDTWGTAIAASTPAYTPGGASFDLIQGIYKVQVRLGTTPYPVYFDDTVVIPGGGSQSRSIQVPGPDSSTTGFYTLSVINSLSSNITVYSGGTSIGTAAASGGTLAAAVRGCSQMTVRDSTTNEVLDGFVMPIGIATYTKRYSTTTYTYTLTNNQDDYRYLFVYLNNLLIGEVSGWGNKKVKAFGSLKNGDQVTIKDQSGTEAPLSPITISGTQSNQL